ncbi:MAG: diaminopimelate decarboxylase [Armatimonadota bacterium]
MFFGTQKVNSKGHLEIGGCDTVELAREFGTPLYVVDEQFLREKCRAYVSNFASRYPQSRIAFAGKAFLTAAMCRILAQEGMYLDVVSAGEIYTAMKADFPMERLYFHGNFKSGAELRMALEQGVGRIVVDNREELELLNAVALEMGKKANILFRITPGIDPHTHKMISTGQADTKFGLNIKSGDAMAAVKRALELPGINLVGIHCHVGSQLLDLEAHTGAIPIVVRFAKEVADETGFVVQEINTGGGLGVRYTESMNPPSIEEFSEVITSTLKKALAETGLPGTPTLVQEPGRSIISPTGTTLYTIGTIKKVPITESPGHRIYVAVDGGITDNPRPALYEAVYTPLAASRMNERASQTVTISGKHCETDTLIVDTKLPELAAGDVLAVLNTGAYNFAMSSNYNRFPRPAVVLVKAGKAEIIVKRETLDDLVARDVIPENLG